MAFERQQRRGIRGCKCCGVTSSKTTAKSNAIGITIVREACREGEMEDNNKAQQIHPRHEKVCGCAISATQVEPCRHRCPPIEDQQSSRRTLLVVWRQQADGRPSHAGMPEVAERPRNNAPETESQKRHDHRKTRPERLETLFEQIATIDVLQYIESTEVGKKLPDGTNKCDS
jgi:hypothetical protein